MLSSSPSATFEVCASEIPQPIMDAGQRAAPLATLCESCHRRVVVVADIANGDWTAWEKSQTTDTRSALFPHLAGEAVLGPQLQHHARLHAPHRYGAADRPGVFGPPNKRAGCGPAVQPDPFLNFSCTTDMISRVAGPPRTCETSPSAAGGAGDICVVVQFRLAVADLAYDTTYSLLHRRLAADRHDTSAGGIDVKHPRRRSPGTWRDTVRTTEVC